MTFFKFFYVSKSSNARRFGFSKKFCLFNQSELTSFVVMQCRVSDKINIKSETFFLL